MIEVRPIVASEWIDRATELTREHWAESEPDVANGPMPLCSVYKSMEQAGLILAFGAFEGTELVGYVVLFVVTHHHYGFTYAQNDVLFVRKDKRATPAGFKLMKAAEDAAHDRGAAFIAWHAKPGSALDTVLGKRSDYKVEDIVYRRVFQWPQ